MSVASLSRIDALEQSVALAEERDRETACAPAAEPDDQTLEAPHPSSDDAMLELAYYHLRAQLAALEQQRRRVARTSDAASVHDMRITTRKIRAALRSFRDLLPEPQRAELNAELRWLATELGKARDLDVYRAHIEGSLDELARPDRAALSAHFEHLDAARAAAGRHLAAALESPRCLRLMQRFEEFLTGQPSPAALRRWGSFRVRDGVDQYLRGALKRVVARGRKARKGSPAKKLHALRIETKRYRYLLELFMPIYEHTLARSLKAARKLQDLLGEHQDACVAETRLRDYAASLRDARRRRDEMLALGQLIHLQGRRASAARRGLRKRWARFVTAAPDFPLAED